MIEHKIFTDVEVKSYDEKNLVVEHFISTEARDRGGDVMKADGMVIKGRPVVLLAHGYSGMGQEPIAKPLKIEAGTFKGKKGILAKTQFFADTIGKRLWQKTTQGFAPNWSIGYIVLAKEDTRDEEGRPTRIVKKWELLEYSLVGTPMQPEAQTVADTEKMASLQFKILNADFLKDLKGQRISIVDERGRPLSVEEIKRAVEDETRAWFWSTMAQK